MTVCADKGWDMFLLKDGGIKQEPLFFRDVTIVSEVIKGTVIKDGTSTPLSGKCSPVMSKPEVSTMSFAFKVLASDGTSVVEIILAGVGYQPAGPGLKPVFRGGYAAGFPVSGATSKLQILVDPGETGTGSGTQT